MDISPNTRNRLAVKDRRQESESYIYSILPQDGSGMSWSGVLQEASKNHYSRATVSRCLKAFERIGLVERKVDGTVYPPRVYYSRKASSFLFPMKFADQGRLCAELDLVGKIVDEGRAGPKTWKIYDEAVNVNLLFMKAALPAILYASLGGKGPYTIKKMSKRKMDILMAQMHQDVHDMANELLDVVLRPWINKFLDLLNILSSSNKEVLEGAGRPALEEAVKALRRYDALLEPYKAK